MLLASFEQLCLVCFWRSFYPDDWNRPLQPTKLKSSPSSGTSVPAFAPSRFQLDVGRLRLNDFMSKWLSPGSKSWHFHSLKLCRGWENLWTCWGLSFESCIARSSVHCCKQGQSIHWSPKCTDSADAAWSCRWFETEMETGCRPREPHPRSATNEQRPHSIDRLASPLAESQIEDSAPQWVCLAPCSSSLWSLSPWNLYKSSNHWQLLPANA